MSRRSRLPNAEQRVVDDRVADQLRADAGVAAAAVVDGVGAVVSDLVVLDGGVLRLDEAHAVTDVAEGLDAVGADADVVAADVVRGALVDADAVRLVAGDDVALRGAAAAD